MLAVTRLPIEDTTPARCRLADAIQRFLANMNDKEEPEDKLPPAVDEALTKLTEIFFQAYSRKHDCGAAPKARTNSMFYLSQSSMSSSAMIQIVNINGGSDVYIASA
jgi:hypothetical protein